MIVTAWQSGSALAGCSAGAIALTGWVPAMRALHREPDPGLGLLPAPPVLPHFDKMLAPLTSSPAPSRTCSADITVLGVDEDTAIVDLSGAGLTWQVHGRQQTWVLTDSSRQPYPAGTRTSTAGA